VREEASLEKMTCLVPAHFPSMQEVLHDLRSQQLSRNGLALINRQVLVLDSERKDGHAGRINRAVA
jgi:hypothetical protein